MKEKTEYERNKDRVYEIYGISKQERKKYSVHHIVFKSDPNLHPEFADFDVNKISNLCPLKKWTHRNLHDKVDNM